MLKSEKFEMGDRKFTVVLFPAVEAFKLQYKVMKIIGGDILSDENGVTVGGLIESITSKISEDEFIELIKFIMKHVICEMKYEGKLVVVNFGDDFDNAFDIVFQGNSMSAYKLIKFIFEVNFPDFFQEGGIGTQI